MSNNYLRMWQCLVFAGSLIISSFMLAQGDQVESNPAPRTKLGENCLADVSCASAFSECKDGTCQCIDGTKADDQLCKPAERTCPFGKPAESEDGNVLACSGALSGGGRPPILGRPPLQPVVNPLPLDRLKDDNQGAAKQKSESCPNNFVCLTNAEEPKGYCCPIQPTCPIGKPAENKSCDYAFGRSPAQAVCPTNSHYCYRITIGNAVIQNCCPKACSNFSDIYKDGICYPAVNVGDSCLIAEQCRSKQATCEEGKCGCAKDKVLTPYGQCQVPYCPQTNGGALQPLKDENGDWMTCPSKNTCGRDTYCAAGTGVCCPKPAAYCPESRTYASPNDQCDPKGPASQCGGPPKYCRTWYSVAIPPPLNDTSVQQSKPSTKAKSLPNNVVNPVVPTINIGLCCRR